MANVGADRLHCRLRMWFFGGYATQKILVDADLFLDAKHMGEYTPPLASNVLLGRVDPHLDRYIEDNCLRQSASHVPTHARVRHTVNFRYASHRLTIGQPPLTCEGQQYTLLFICNLRHIAFDLV